MSAAGMVFGAVIVMVIITGVVCYKRRVQRIRVEQQSKAAIEIQTNIFYQPSASSADTGHTGLHPNPSYRPVDTDASDGYEFVSGAYNLLT